MWKRETARKKNNPYEKGGGLLWGLRLHYHNYQGTEKGENQIEKEKDV